jgi:hypothetical protein
VVIWNKNKFVFFTLFPTSALKKLPFSRKKKKDFSLFLFHPLHHLHCKYGAPKQAKHEKIYVFGPICIFSSAQIF